MSGSTLTGNGSYQCQVERGGVSGGTYKWVNMRPWDPKYGPFDPKYSLLEPKYSLLEPKTRVLEPETRV